MRRWLRLATAIDRLNDRIYKMIRWLTLAMIVLGAANALLRYGDRWTDIQISSNALFDLQWYLFSMIFLLGAAYGLRHDVHVRVDVLYSRLGARARAWIDLLGTLVFLLPFSIVMLITAWPAVRNSWIVREVSPDPGGLPRYPIKALLLVSFGLLVLQGIAVVIREILTLKGRLEPEGAGGGPGAGGDVEFRPDGL